jgi:hypothetical protein
MNSSRRRALSAAVVVSGLVLLGASSASAATSPTYTGTVALSLTNWNKTITIAKFDPSLGTLTGVTCTLNGTAQGTARIENTNEDAPNTITAQLAVTETLQKPDGSGPLVQVIPLVNSTATYPIYDGATDFGGTSGVTLPLSTNTATASRTATDAPTLALFIASAPGQTVNLPMKAVGTSSVIDESGNVASSFTTRASASVSCQYTYTESSIVPQIPTGAVVLAVGGVGALALAATRRRFVR